MKKENEGYAMPLGSSPYQEPPYPAGRNAELLMIEYEPVDPSRMEAEVPEPLEFVKGTRPLVWIFDAPQLTGAIYHEAALLFRVRFGGNTGHYVPYIWGDTDEAMFLNRELYGWPQMLCDHDILRKDGNLVYGKVTRRRETLLSASLFLERASAPEELPLLPDWLQVRKFPCPVKGGKPFRQVVHLTVTGTVIHELWIGRAALQIGPSAEFRLNGLEPAKVIGGFYMKHSFDLPPATEVIDAPF